MLGTGFRDQGPDLRRRDPLRGHGGTRGFVGSPGRLVGGEAPRGVARLGILPHVGWPE